MPHLRSPIGRCLQPRGLAAGGGARRGTEPTCLRASAGAGVQHCGPVRSAPPSGRLIVQPRGRRGAPLLGSLWVSYETLLLQSPAGCPQHVASLLSYLNPARDATFSVVMYQSPTEREATPRLPSPDRLPPHTHRDNDPESGSSTGTMAMSRLPGPETLRNSGHTPATQSRRPPKDFSWPGPPELDRGGVEWGARKGAAWSWESTLSRLPGSPGRICPEPAAL